MYSTAFDDVPATINFCVVDVVKFVRVESETIRPKKEENPIVSITLFRTDSTEEPNGRRRRCVEPIGW